MHKFLLLAAAGVLASSPAFAQTRQVVRPVVAVAQQSTTVIEMGQYRGADPDPAIRLDLRRDNEAAGQGA